jgi:hypothetical protein
LEALDKPAAGVELDLTLPRPVRMLALSHCLDPRPLTPCFGLGQINRSEAWDHKGNETS